MPESTLVGLAQAAVTTAPEEVLTAMALGSCVGVFLRDPISGCTGLAHVVLPSSELSDGSDPLRYADTAIPGLIDRMARRGARRERLVCALCGGANVFAFANGEFANIGGRNAQAVKRAVRQRGIAIRGEDLGGKKPRTASITAGTGEIRIYSPGEAERVFCTLG
ncbi:MAG: chemotaxis protein CheD [Armatimonadia bacterium]|nr:chemotaxis protein CheD [Armatimonadia bacterium]